MARPSDYNALEHPKIARELTAMGKTKAEVAELIGINRSTVVDWQNSHPEFAVAFKLGVEDATDRVERALLERAVGYTIDSVKPMVVAGPKGEGSVVEMIGIKVHYPSDTAAAAMWLKNRRAKEWRDRQEIEHSGKLSLEQLLSDVSKPAEEHG